jgi:predicted RNA methylase
MENLVLQSDVVGVDESGRRKFDAYFTSDAVATALVERLSADCFWRGGTVLEPSAGRGAFVRAIGKTDPCPDAIFANDMDPLRVEELKALNAAESELPLIIPSCSDFLQLGGAYDLILGNPPYSHAEEHARKALALRARCGVVAFLLRLGFLESEARVPFWKEHPASKVYVLSQRPSFTGGGTDNCPYGFFVWDRCCRTQTTMEVISWR